MIQNIYSFIRKHVKQETADTIDYIISTILKPWTLSFLCLQRTRKDIKSPTNFIKSDVTIAPT